VIKEDDQISRWAEYVKSQPDWKKIHTKFINAQLEKRITMFKKLLKQKNGFKKAMEVLGIRDEESFRRLLG